MWLIGYQLLDCLSLGVRLGLMENGVDHSTDFNPVLSELLGLSLCHYVLSFGRSRGIVQFLVGPDRCALRSRSEDGLSLSIVELSVETVWFCQC